MSCTLCGDANDSTAHLCIRPRKWSHELNAYVDMTDLEEAALIAKRCVYPVTGTKGTESCSDCYGSGWRGGQGPSQDYSDYSDYDMSDSCGTCGGTGIVGLDKNVLLHDATLRSAYEYGFQAGSTSRPGNADRGHGMTLETRITVDCWIGRWHILGVAFACLCAALKPGSSVVVIRRESAPEKRSTPNE